MHMQHLAAVYGSQIMYGMLRKSLQLLLLLKLMERNRAKSTLSGQVWAQLLSWRVHELELKEFQAVSACQIGTMRGPEMRKVTVIHTNIQLDYCVPLLDS